MYIEYVEKLDAKSLLEPDLFDELFEIESEFERESIVLQLEDRAKILGVKTRFMEIYKLRKRDYKNLLKAEKQVLTEVKTGSYVTEFTGQEHSLDCGSWQCTDSGVSIITEKGPLVACSHPIYPIGVLVNAETNEYKVIIRFKVRGKWRETIEDRDTIASSNKIIALASKGVRVTSENAKLLVRYLSDIESLNEDLILEMMSTSRLGWIGSTFMPYEDEIVFDNEQNLRTLFKSIHLNGFRDSWYEHMKEIRKNRRLELQIYLASALASVLVEPCGTLPFIVSLWGGTGRGKTVALMMATSVWADPSEGQYMTDAKATTTAMEIRLDCLNSLPMTLDDMAQIKNQYDGDFSELVYRWCAGKGRDRSNQKLGLNKLTSWRNCTLTNGERSLISESMQGGAVNRIIDVEIEDRDLFEDGNYSSKIFRQHFGFCGQEFVETIKEIGFEELNRMAEEKVKLLKDIAKEQNQEKEDKQILPMALILLADQIATDYLFKDDIYLDSNKCCDLLKNKGEVSEHKRAYEYLKDMVTIQSFHYADSIDEAVNGNTEFWGYWKDADTVVIIRSAFSRILDQGGFQSKAFLSWAKKNNLVECDKEGSPTRNVKIKGSSNRCVFLRMVDLDEKKEQEDEFGEIPFD
ncbi:MAG: DUF927 domain-containing protein [Bacteroidales bacterium]|nr:DUF927 domain-containing protein [Candidatus Scybalousia scybalohippi]